MCIVCFYIGFCGVVFAQVVDIPDPNLAQAIREELALPAGSEITVQDLQRLTFLDADNHDITNLSGLEHAVNLEDLEMWGNPISDLTPVAKLKRLRVLDLGFCLISDIAPVANLTTLTHLLLGDNQISDTSPLVNLTQLRLLLLFANEIEDISPLANLTNIVELNLRSNNISDISPLSNLSFLEYLDISRCQIVDISPLANLIQLKVLQLNGNQIVDVEPLSNLTSLYKLEIHENLVADYSPIENLPLAIFVYDEYCEVVPFSVHDRIKDRDYPSIFTAFTGPNIFNRPDLSDVEKTASHDLWFGAHFGLSFKETAKKWAGELNNAIQRRDELLDLNPNMLFLAQINMRGYHLDEYPEDFPYWIRDSDGNIVDAFVGQYGLIDFTHPDIQDRIVQQAIAVAKCGLYDGIFFDWWTEDGAILADLYGDWSHKFRGNKAEQEARDNILRRIRAGTRSDFLIMGNTNREIIPRTAPHINGGFMETLVPGDGSSIGLKDGFEKIERSLLWLEQNSREPRINALEGWGVPTEAPDSPINLRYMRAITCLSLTHSDGYVLFNMGLGHEHYWYDFWDADLGRPVGPKVQLYGRRYPRILHPRIHQRLGGIQPQRRVTDNHIAGGNAWRR